MSIGVRNRYDLSTLKGFQSAAKLIRTCRPKYLHISPPCDPWTAVQTCNQRNPEQVHRLQERRQVNKKLLRNLRRLVEIQVLELNRQEDLKPFHVQHHAGGEHPQGYGSVVRWSFFCSWLPTWFRLSKHWDVLLKPWGWLSTHMGVRKAL